MELYIKDAGATSPFAKASGDSPPKPKAKEDISYLSELTHTPSQHKKMAMVFWVWG